MKRLTLLSALVLILLAACSSAPVATATPAPPTSTPIPPTATTPPTGFSGKVEYMGSAQGNILILALDHAPTKDENPAPVAIETYMGPSGEFSWPLPAGTYFITAFYTIGRDPQGPPLPNEPTIFCNPIHLGENELITLYIPLADADEGGVNKDCVASN